MPRLHPPRLALIAVLICTGCAAYTPPGPPPYEPHEALATFQVEPGFTVELVAAEPLIADPVAIEIDENGRLFVAEMPGYPLDLSGTGRVRLLSDTDGDGRHDHSTVFADSLVLPTGLMRWKDGLLIADPPDILYVEDTDGDGEADERRVVLTGFALSNPQHNANGLLYGLDNWIYLANEGVISWTDYDALKDTGSDVYYPERPDGARLGRNALDRNVRFRPDTYALESMSGRSQFGHTFDAWGHHFVVNNANHHMHEVLAASYVARNPDVPLRYVEHDTPDHGAAAAVYPITRNPEHQLLTDRGVFTSAAGLTYYLGGLFPAPYGRVTFVAEPVHNLVHADLVEDDGATFVARRLQEQREFLASIDAWFRPVNTYIGPDGALYVVDYYRQIVEHPEWMDEATAASGAVRNGTARGRIYRIVPDATAPYAWPGNLHLGGASTGELVQALAHANIWWRRTAQRLLVDRRDEAAVQPLVRMVRERPSALARLHALWTLEGLESLDETLLREALSDDEAGVRENGVRLAELHLDDAPGLAADLLELTDDPHPKVRFQLLNTLGQVTSEAGLAARNRLLREDIEDPWVQVAALLATPPDVPNLFESTLADLADVQSPERSAYVERVSALIAVRQRGDDVQRLLRRLGAPPTPEAAWWQAAGLKGLAAGLRRRETPLPPLDGAQQRVLELFFEAPTADLRTACLEFLEVTALPPGPSSRGALERAAALVADATATPDRRADALRLLALAGPAPYEDLIKQTISPSEHALIQQAAVRTLGQIAGPEAGIYLLSIWETLSPDIRDVAIDALMQSADRIRLLLDAIEARTVQPSAIGWGRTVRLMEGTEGDLKALARALLSEQAGVRQDVIARYRAATTNPGDVARGRAVFIRVCSSCHQVQGTSGTAFGPDLGTVRHWSAPALMTEILDPGRSLADGYELWTITRQDGAQLTGVVAFETPTSVTLREAGGKETTIARPAIRTMHAANVSAMPPGLEQQLSEQDMADLIAFLTHG